MDLSLCTRCGAEMPPEQVDEVRDGGFLVCDLCARFPADHCYQSIPSRIKSAMVKYVDHGIQPGSFLTHVICGEITAVLSADDQIRSDDWALVGIVKWFYGSGEDDLHPPRECRGSREAFKAWKGQQFTQKPLRSMPY